MRVNLDKFLLKVEKPGQYLGNEINSIHKDEFKARMCLFFPDIYEVGMSNLGIRILYSLQRTTASIRPDTSTWHEKKIMSDHFCKRSP